MRIAHVLGLNARNHLYTSRYNSRKAKTLADSKLATKEVLKKANLAMPKLFAVFREEQDLQRFDFSTLPDDFVIKPNEGLGGGGIIVLEKRGSETGTWMTSKGETIGVEDMKLHIRDILAGSFSMHATEDTAYIEERVRIHDAFAKYAYHGTPDIRIIVFNNIPVMAMLRMPTRESGGRANLFQGAVAAGIDMEKGITTYGVHHGREIVFFPETRRKIRGIVIPDWDAVLTLAIRCQQVTKLGYLGADIVIQPEKGPMVLELNAQPGLKIQMANKAGLKKRLERVEGLEVDSVDKGVKIAKALFADPSMKGVAPQRTIHVFETVSVVGTDGEKTSVEAKVDSGAFRTSIDRSLAKNLGLLKKENVLMRATFESALGQTSREIIGMTYYLQGKKIQTTVSVADRKHLRKPMIIGRKDLKGFVLEFPL